MMDREVGDRGFPLWLIGDSNPIQWESYLKTPLDPRHPIRHNIWTALLDVSQDKVYRSSRLRVDTSSIYIRNAVANPSKMPLQSSAQWSPAAESELSCLRDLLETHKPVMVFCFGAFAFEFVRRAVGEPDRQKFSHWGASRLGDEFRRRIEEFDSRRTNIIPLLHRSISGGKFVESHKYFCGAETANYFEVVGAAIADKFLQHREQLRIWIE